MRIDTKDRLQPSCQRRIGMWICSAFSWLDRNIEPVVMNVCYGVMVILVFLQVVLRFGFQNQLAWGSAVAIYMFIWVVWLGAAYGIRMRSHLCFGAIRERQPYVVQFICLVVDAALWISLAVVMIYYSAGQVKILESNFSTVPGSFYLMQWWFYMIGPISWGLIILRATQNLWKDIRTFAQHKPFVLSGNMLGD